MAIKTQDWNTFIALTKARAGSRLKDTELVDIGVLANAAARTINDYSPYWTRLLKLQERSVDSVGNITYTEDSYEVKGAGTPEVNGLYVRNGSYSGKVAYTKFDGDTELYSIWSDGAANWNLAPNGPGSMTGLNQYGIADASDTPPLTGWGEFFGSSPAPTLSTLDDIDEVITVWTGNKTSDSTVKELRGWYASADGINIGTTDYDTVFVGFKKDLTDIYGDGTGGTVSSIPFEWADYMSYSAARVLQDGQRTAQDFAGIALRQIDEVLNNQLMKINRANAMNVFKHNLDTYFNNDHSTL
jgi:hypothetical protein